MTIVAQKGFELVKKVLEKPMLALPAFDKVLWVDCDATRKTIGAVMSQEGRKIALFNEKINESKHK